MKTLIKAADRGHGFAIESLAPSVSRQRDDASSAPGANARPATTEGDRLRAALAERNTKIEELTQKIDAAYSEGQEAGRLAAELEIEDDRADSLARLQQTFDGAREDLANSLVNVESLALLVARQAIDKMFGQAEDRQQVVQELIQNQLRRMGSETAVKIDVSRSDFPDTREIAALAEALGVSAECLSVLDDLESGDCRLRLRLGTLEIGRDQQWSTICSALAELDESGGIET
jgi:flagellar biosynthesis/type III secretory pathway protein FliH